MKKIQIVIVIGVIFLAGSFSVSFAGSAKTISKVNSIIKDNSPYMIESAVSLGDKPLDENQAVRLALSNNLALQAMFERYGVDRADIIEQSLLKNPTIGFSSRASDEPDTKRNTEIELKVDVLDLILWPLKKKSGSTQIKSIEYQLANQVLDFTTETRLMFYELQEAQALMAFLEDDKKAQEAALELAKRQFEAGNINLLDWQIAQTVFQESQMKYFDAQRDEVIAREQLNLLLGLPEGENEWKIVNEFQPIADSESDLESLEKTALDHRLEIIIAKGQIGILKNKQTMVRAGVIPSVEVGYNQEQEPSGHDLKGFTIETEVPFFNRNQSGRLRYESLLSEAKINVPAVQALVIKEVRVAYQQLRTARAKVESFQSILPVYQQIVRQTLYHYNFMLKDVFSVLQAKREQLHAQSESIRAMHEYWQARAQLEHAVGRSLPYTPLKKIMSPDVNTDLNSKHQEHHHGG